MVIGYGWCVLYKKCMKNEKIGRKDASEFEMQCKKGSASAMQLT